jgi:hypothetical protein
MGLHVRLLRPVRQCMASQSDSVKMYPDFKSRSKALYDRALASLPGGNTRTPCS